MPYTLFPKHFFKHRPRRNKSYIAIADHISRHDIPLVAFALLTFRFLFVARTNLKILRPIEENYLGLRRLLEGRLLLFIDNQQPTIQQWKDVVRAVNNKNNRVVVIFPHGATLGNRQIHAGFIRLARQSQRLILPIKIKPWGCYGRKNGETPKKIYTWQAFKTSILVGKAFSLNDSSLKEKASQIAQEKGCEVSDQELAEAAMIIVHEIN